MADAPDTERQATEPDTGEVLSVTELNDRIAAVVEEAPALDGVRCIGEVTDLHQNSTALYFTLTDGNVSIVFRPYGVALSSEGEVMGVEILNYRETHGDEVRRGEWRDQFTGKTLEEPLKLGRDIDNISGATLSCRNLTDGIRRLLALHQVVLSDE